METAKIKTLMIFEMIGRPVEHLKSTMAEYIGKIGSESGVTLLKETVHDIKKVEHKNKEGKVIEEEEGRMLFSTFAELEIEAKTMMDIVRLIFAYQPSHVEILSPKEMALDNLDFSTVFNEIIRKLHEYDAVAKALIIQNHNLRSQVEENERKNIIDQLKETDSKMAEEQKSEKK